MAIGILLYYSFKRRSQVKDENWKIQNVRNNGNQIILTLENNCGNLKEVSVPSRPFIIYDKNGNIQ